MKSLIGLTTIASLALTVAGCGGGSGLVEEKCGALIERSKAAVERGLAGKAVGTYSGRGAAETGGTYLTGQVVQYAVRDDGSSIMGPVINYEFTGELKDGIPEGLGVANYACKKFDCIYVGEWNNGTKHGRGVMRIGKSCYVGEWVYDEPHGQGTRYDVHTYHGLGTTVGTFRHGNAWDTDNYNDDTLVGRIRDGNYKMAEEYLANKEMRRRNLEQKTRTILDIVLENM